MPTLVAILALALQAIVMIVGGIWFVAKVNTRSEQHFARFDATIDHLATTVKEVGRVVDKLDDKLDEHGQRLAVVENTLQNDSRRWPPPAQGRNG